MANLTPIETTSSWRYEILAAASLDRQWQYERVGGGGWAVTHATGRRYWTTDLDQARRDTADGTAAARLDLGREPRPGKPMTEGERTAIRGELSARNLAAMLDYTRPRAAEAAAGVLLRLDLPADYLDHYTVAPSCANKILGAVWSEAPSIWLDALRTARPDLVPPHLATQPA